jgi:hypothetical protein
MLRRLPIVLIAAWVALFALGPVLAAVPVYPKGMRIGLEPPGDLKLSTHFPGFEDPDRQVSISILQLQAMAYEEIERSIFAKNQATMTNVKRESFPFQNGVGFLITGDETVNGTIIHRWYLASTGLGPEFGDLAMLIKVEVPDTAGAIYSDAVIRKALASVTFRTPPVEEALALLPFKLKDLAGFRVLRVQPGNGAILIDGPGQDMVKSPYVIISIGRSAPENPDDRARFAREMLAAAPLRDVTLTMAEAIRIDGGPGFEARATATGYDGKKLALVQWLRFGGGGFLRVIGAVHQENWDQLFPRFREVRDGINAD